MILEFLNQGLSVIPLTGKRPVITRWQRYNIELPSRHIVSLWETLYQGSNIGVCVGPASGIMAVDIDTDDKRTHEIVPPSPIARVGRAGRELRFYRYNPKIKSIKDHSRGIEVFSNTGQVVIPPSIHPDTNEQYRWVGEINFTTPGWREHLPIMENTDWIKDCPILNSQTNCAPVGRNNALTRLVCAMLARGETVERTIDEALNFDIENHSPTLYFTDMSEPEAKQAGGKAREAARIFVERHKRQMDGKGMIISIQQSIINQDVPSSIKKIDFPEPKGLLNKIYRDILRCSRREQPLLAYGGALAILSVCSLGRYSWNGTWPNLFIMNIAGSGSGKGIVYEYIKDLLSHDRIQIENLIGQSNWSSSIGMVIDFPEQRFRIDLLDEFGKTLKQIALGDPHKESTLYTASELYSINGRRFIGSKAINRGEKTGDCIGPGLTVLASVQPEIFVEYTTREMFDSGFLNRFIYLFADQKPESKGFTKIDVNEVARDISNYILSRNSLDLSSGDSIKSMKPNCIELESAPGVIDYLNDVINSLDEIEERHGLRSLETCMKLAIISAISDERRVVINDDIDFGVNFIEAMVNHVAYILAEARSGSPFEKVQNNLVRFIASNNGQCTMVDAANFLRHKTPRDRREIVLSLVERGVIRADGDRLILSDTSNIFRQNYYCPTSEVQ